MKASQFIEALERHYTPRAKNEADAQMVRKDYVRELAQFSPTFCNRPWKP